MNTIPRWHKAQYWPFSYWSIPLYVTTSEPLCQIELHIYMAKNFSSCSYHIRCCTPWTTREQYQTYRKRWRQPQKLANYPSKRWHNAVLSSTSVKNLIQGKYRSISSKPVHIQNFCAFQKKVRECNIVTIINRFILSAFCFA